MKFWNELETEDKSKVSVFNLYDLISQEVSSKLNWKASLPILEEWMCLDCIVFLKYFINAELGTFVFDRNKDLNSYLLQEENKWRSLAYLSNQDD